MGEMLRMHNRSMLHCSYALGEWQVRLDYPR